MSKAQRYAKAISMTPELEGGKEKKLLCEFVHTYDYYMFFYFKQVTDLVV